MTVTPMNQNKTEYHWENPRICYTCIYFKIHDCHQPEMIFPPPYGEPNTCPHYSPKPTKDTI